MDASDRSCPWRWKQNVDLSGEEEKKLKKKHTVARIHAVYPVAKDAAKVPEANPEGGGGG